MKGEKIPDQNHIARFCRPWQVHEEQIQATAFMLREGEEYLSVNWLEFLNCSNRENEITKLRTIYSETFTVGARAKKGYIRNSQVVKSLQTQRHKRFVSNS